MAANKLERELKRGSAELLILALLEERQRHGYEIGQLIASRSEGAINFHITSLYPTLYRLEEGGFIDGENVAIAFRWARGDYSRLPTLATDLVSRRVNVISALGGPSSALAAKRATSTIPIVTSLSADTTGLVESFNRPGGNVTASQSRPI